MTPRGRAALATVLAVCLTGCAVLEDLVTGLPEPEGRPPEGRPPEGRPPEDAAPAPGVFSLPGVIHRPRLAAPVRRVAVDVPAGTYRVLELELSVTHGGWARQRPKGVHNVFWLARDRNRDLFGYVNVRNQNQVFLRHGIGQRQPDKARVAKGMAWPPGTTYRFHYLYDTRGRRIELTVRDAGRAVAKLQDVPDVAAIVLGAQQRLLVDLGFTGTDNPNEPATLGWTYRDLVVRVR